MLCARVRAVSMLKTIDTNLMQTCADGYRATLVCLAGKNVMRVGRAAHLGVGV